MKVMKMSRELSLLTLLSGCAISIIGGIAYTKSQLRSPGEIEMYSDAKLMQAEVSKHISVGSDIKKAKAIMERSGFGCAIEINGTYRPNMSFEQAAKSGGKTSLVCIKTTKFIFSNTWRVKISYKAGKVTGVKAYYRSTASDF